MIKLSELRKDNIGASEIAALFHMSPYESYYSLWLRKAKKIAENNTDNVNTRFGNFVESFIAEEIAKEKGWKVSKYEGYALHPKIKGMGCTPDYLVESDKGKGLLEIKNIGATKYGQEMPGGEPPFPHILQLQHQLACLPECSWGAIGAWVRGERLQVWEYEPRQKTISLIEEKVVEFWKSIDLGIAPVPDDHPMSYQAINELYPMKEEVYLDLRHDQKIDSIIEAYLEQDFIESQASKEATHQKTLILAKTGSAHKITTSSYDIKRGKNNRLYINERKI